MSNPAVSSANKRGTFFSSPKRWVITGSVLFLILFLVGEYFVTSGFGPESLGLAYNHLFDLASSIAGAHQLEDIPSMLLTAAALGGLLSGAAGALAGWTLYHAVRGCQTMVHSHLRQPRR
jgi:hypothetical protein